MRIIQYQGDDGARAGWVDGHDRTHDLGLADRLSIERLVAGEVAASAPGPHLSELILLPPLFGSRRVFAVGRNYSDHAAEMGGSVPEWPNFFMRTPQSLVGHGSPLEYPHGFSSYDYEGELAVVIGLPGRAIPAERSLGHLLGYACFMDGSVREIQKHSLVAGKNFDRSGAVGPWIVTADELPATPSFSLKTGIGGSNRQQASTAEMVFSLAELIHALSLVTELLPGDVIATGTPSHVGASFDPPRFLQPGDEVTVTIGGIGTLRNIVAGPR